MTFGQLGSGDKFILSSPIQEHKADETLLFIKLEDSIKDREGIPPITAVTFEGACIRMTDDTVVVKVSG